MNLPKCKDSDYIDFIIATPRQGTATEAARVQPVRKNTPAEDRWFCPDMVCFDSRYASIENLKLIRCQGWHFLTRLKSNRLINADRQGLKVYPKLRFRSLGVQYG